MTGKPIDFSKLKETKVTLPLIAVVTLFVIGWKFDGLTVDYLDEFFMSKANAEEQFTVITEQTTQTRTLIVTHINEYKLNENAKATANASTQLYNLELYVAANGASDLTNNRQRDLAQTLARLGRARACIIRNATASQTANPPAPENCDAII